MLHPASLRSRWLVEKGKCYAGILGFHSMSPRDGLGPGDLWGPAGGVPWYGFPSTRARALGACAVSSDRPYAQAATPSPLPPAPLISLPRGLAHAGHYCPTRGLLCWPLGTRSEVQHWVMWLSSFTWLTSAPLRGGAAFGLPAVRSLGVGAVSALGCVSSSALSVCRVCRCVGSFLSGVCLGAEL